MKVRGAKGVDRWVMRKAKGDEESKEEGGKDIDDDKFSVFGKCVLVRSSFLSALTLEL